MTFDEKMYRQVVEAGRGERSVSSRVRVRHRYSVIYLLVVGSNGRLDVVIRSIYRSSSVIVSYFGVFVWGYISK